MPTPTSIVAEDDPAVRRLLSLVLADLGYAVVAVGDGRAALDEAIHRPPALVVADDPMPGMGGVRLAAELRARGSRVPVLLVSETHQASQVPNVTVLGKPFRPAQVRAAVAAATENA